MIAELPKDYPGRVGDIDEPSRRWECLEARHAWRGDFDGNGRQSTLAVGGVGHPIGVHEVAAAVRYAEQVDRDAA